MQEWECLGCGEIVNEAQLKANQVPANDEEAAKRKRGESYTAKSICPECGNDNFEEK